MDVGVVNPKHPTPLVWIQKRRKSMVIWFWARSLILIYKTVAVQ